MMPKLFVLVLAVACSLLVQPSVQAQEFQKEAMPLSNSPSASDIKNAPTGLSYRQQQARYVAEQALARMEWNKWHGYEPLRPNTNSSYIVAGLYSYQPSYNYLQSAHGYITPAYSFRGMSNAQRRLYGW